MRTTMAAAIVVLIGAGAAAGQNKVTELKALYRQGQVFLTWKELADVKGEKYEIYRGDEAITAANLDKARKLATVAENSGAFPLEQQAKALAAKTGIEGYGQRYIIQDNPANDPKAMLPEGVGLFVLTVKKAGTGFYAVAPVLEGKAVPAGLAATEAVQEKVELPGAVLVWKNQAGTGAVYTHWMDGETWDPMSEGNAYNFGLAVPDKYDGKEPLPVMFYGHGMGQGYSISDTAPYCRAVWVWMGDKSGTWFFGMLNRDKTKVVNYTEQRLRWLAEWLKAERPNQFWRVNPKLYQAHGHSMGGTMCNALAVRMGDIFTCTVSSSGATIHRRSKTWVGQAEKLWGAVDKNLPGPEGMGAWDYQDYAKYALEHPEKESAYLLLSNGKGDGSVVFEPVPDFLAALQKAKKPFAAHWDGRGHSNNFYGNKNAGWSTFKLPLDEPLPAFANASNNDDIASANTGTINGKLEWSASGNNFDKNSADDDIVDTPEMFAMNIRSLSGPATVDVTPRRLQKFKGVAGKKYEWENQDCADPKAIKKVDSGTVTADKYGLITVEKFAVGKDGWGNRLVIRPAK